MPKWKQFAAKAPVATVLQLLQCDLRLTAAKHKKYYACSCSNEKPWRSRSAAICRHWVAKHKSSRVNAPLHCSNSNAQTVSTRAKHNNSTAPSKKRKSHLEPSVPLRAKFEKISRLRRRRPHPSRKRANFSPHRNFRLPEKKRNVSCKSQRPNRIHDSWKRRFRARLPSNSRGEDVKMMLSCEASFKFQGFNSSPLNSTLLNSTLSLLIK